MTGEAVNFMLIEWFGGLWQIIGFFSDLDEVWVALRHRRQGSKHKILRVELVTNLEKDSEHG